MRVNSNGRASLAPHPQALGSKLTHPHITTDFSENLLEFITSVKSNTKELFEELIGIHGYTACHIEDEYFWPSSMPCILPSDDKIPLAYYGNSNVGRLKTLYRKGLSYRYGSSMQTIAGVHYNFSFSDDFWKKYKEFKKSELTLKDFKNQQYFHLIRNFKRYSWVLMYLFGASPVVHSSFLNNKKHDLKKIGDDTYATEQGLSLRMGGLGYTSSAQKQIKVCFDEVKTYIKTLEQARLESYPAYEDIGLIRNDEYLQLNTHLLQIDNEFYSTIRPKNIAKSRESALKALHLRGVEYIEVRLIDVDPFSPLGVNVEQIHFLHLFLTWCLLSESELMTNEEYALVDENFLRVVKNGQDPELKLLNQNKQEVAIKELLVTFFDQLGVTLNPLLSQAKYKAAFEVQFAKIADLNKIPAVKLLNELAQNNNDYIHFIMNKAKEFRKHYTCGEGLSQRLDELKTWSEAEQLHIEKADKLSFDDFLKKYFSDIKISYD